MSERPKSPENPPPQKPEQERNVLVSAECSVKRHEKDNKENQDSMLNLMSPDRRSGLFAVADGVGGALGGAEASKTTVETLKNSFSKMEEIRRRREAGDKTATIESEAGVLRVSLREANARIILKREEMPQFSHMSTTCVAARITRDSQRHAIGIVAHVGDSRAYAQYPDGRLETLTLDDHFVLQVIKKTHGEEEALHVQNILDDSVGKAQTEIWLKNDPRIRPWMIDYYYKRHSEVSSLIGNHPEVKVKMVYLPSGSRMVLGTDGLDGLLKKELKLILGHRFDQLPYEGVRRAVIHSSGDVAQTLVAAAKWRQGEWGVHPRSRGPDDASAVTVSVL